MSRQETAGSIVKHKAEAKTAAKKDSFCCHKCGFAFEKPIFAATSYFRECDSFERMISMKKVSSAGRQQDEELWKQFREAQQHFYDRRTAFYEDNKTRKEALVARAKELSSSEDWDSTFEEMKAMMADWRTVGTAGNRDLDNKLWDAFRGGQNAFFDRRFESQAKREQESRDAVRGKEQIVSAVE